MNKKDKIVGSFVGGAVGDALGYPIEFIKNMDDKQYTKYKDDVGQISDDTQMSLFTATALLWRTTRLCTKGIAPELSEVLYTAYKEWYDTQIDHTLSCERISWIMDVKELCSQRAPGGTCISSLSSGKKGTLKNPINDSKGCGGIMRVAPIGLYARASEYAGLFAAEASAITHGHPLGIIPSYVFSTMIWFIVYEDLNIEEALNKAMKQYKKKFKLGGRKYRSYFIRLVEKAIELSKKDMLDIEAIREIGQGWVAEETFAIAIYSCLKHKDSFIDAVVCSINHEGDSDSTGAVTGNLMGALLGINSIPKYYIDNLEIKEVIFEIGTDLASEVPDNDELWTKKYINCKK